jgi:hypothetical protein
MKAIPTKYLTETVTIAPFASVDGEGTSTPGPPKSYPARIERKSRLVMNAAGQMVQQAGVVFIGGPVIPLVSNRDRMTLPDGTTPPIIVANRMDDQFGVPHHVEISFG